MIRFRSSLWFVAILLAAVLSLDFHATCEPLTGANPSTAPATAPADLARGATSPATQPAGSQPDLQTQITQAIGELSADNFKTREAATKRLAAIGPAVVPAMQTATTDPDPEVSQRARTVLKLVREKLVDELPAAQATKVREYFAADANGRPGTLQQLLDDKDSETVITLLDITEIDGDPALKEEILAKVADSAADMVADFVSALLAAGRVEEAQRFMDRPNVRHKDYTRRDFVIFAFLRGRLDEAIAQEEELDPDDRDGKLLTSLHLAKGDLVKAAAAASQADDEEMKFFVACMAGDWKSAAKSYDKQHAPADGNDAPPPANVDNLPQQDVIVPNPGMRAGRQVAQPADNAADDKLSELSCTALLHQLTGHKAPVDKAIAEIKEYPAQSLYQVARDLAVIGRLADAIEAAGKAPAGKGSFDYLVAQCRYQEAIDYVPASQPDGFKFEKVKLLRSLGEFDKAKVILDELAKAARATSDKNTLGNIYVELSKCGFEKEARAALGEVEKIDPAAACFWISQRTGKGGQRTLFEKLVNAENPDDAPAEKAAQLKALLGEPMTRDRFAALAEKADKKWATSQADVPDQNFQTTAGRYGVIADACEEAGFLDLANLYLDKAVASALSEVKENDNTEERGVLDQSGKWLLRQNRWLEAADRFGQVWKLSAKTDQPDHLSVFYQGWALTMAGRKAEGAKLIRLAELLVLSEEDSERTQLADAMATCGLAKEAAHQWEIMLRATDSLPSEPSLNRAAHVALDAGDFNRATNYWQCARLAHFLGDATVSDDAEHYLRAAARPHVARALQFAATSRPDEALAEADRARQLLPLDPDLGILTVNALAKMGQTKLADAVFEKYGSFIDKLLEKYPRSCDLHNRIAWLEVRCRRNLDDALKHAELAVKLDPQQANHFDTLAEVYFQRGDRAKAIETIERATRLEPYRDYFRSQEERFRTGDPKSSPLELFEPLSSFSPFSP